MGDRMCIAQVSDPPHYLHTRNCTRKATQIVGGYHVCGTHARKARQWEAEGNLAGMVTFWWRKDTDDR